MLGVGHGTDGLDCRLDDADGVDRPQVQLELARHDSRQVEEVVDQLREKRGVALDHFEGTNRARVIQKAALEHACPTEHRCERRAQLMRYHREKTVLGLVGRLKFPP